MKPRIMYIECKAGGLSGPARIGRVSFSKTGRSLYYDGRTFRSLRGAGFKANYYDVETGEEYWISGPKKDGSDRLYGERVPWRSTRTSARSTGRRSGASRTAPTRSTPAADRSNRRDGRGMAS